MYEEPRCVYCQCTNEESELRPYAANGRWLCFPCMEASPELEEEAIKQFVGQMNAATQVSSTNSVTIGTMNGPVPFDPELLH